MKKKTEKKSSSPRVAHIDFQVEKELQFLKYVKYLSSPWHIMWRNFLAGSFRGLGFLVGSAVLLWVLGWFLGQVLGEVPLLSDFARAMDLWLEQQLNQ